MKKMRNKWNVGLIYLSHGKSVDWKPGEVIDIHDVDVKGLQADGHELLGDAPKPKPEPKEEVSEKEGEE